MNYDSAQPESTVRLLPLPSQPSTRPDINLKYVDFINLSILYKPIDTLFSFFSIGENQERWFLDRMTVEWFNKKSILKTTWQMSSQVLDVQWLCAICSWTGREPAHPGPSQAAHKQQGIVGTPLELRSV